MTASLGSDSDKMEYEVEVEVIPQGLGMQNTNVFYTNNFSSSFAQDNLHTVKLTYRWPVLPNLQLGSGRKVLVTQFRGHLRPKKLIGTNNYVDIAINDRIEVQNLGQVNAAQGLNYGFVFEGTMLR